VELTDIDKEIDDYVEIFEPKCLQSSQSENV
jgi:hypothetical protein